MNNAVILLSGGLDSLVALGYSIKHTNFDVKLALTFDYGQKTSVAEINASKKICEYYNIQHEVIKLDWLRDVSQNSAIVGSNKSENDIRDTKSAWVPNRNSLFLNIAACYCDSKGYDYIIFGANVDEAGNFPDNTEEFRKRITECFEYSTMTKPKVVAPLINYTKDDIVRIAIEDSIPLDLVRSCYNSNEKHCGYCESCNYLKKALLANNCEKYIELLF